MDTRTGEILSSKELAIRRAIAEAQIQTMCTDPDDAQRKLDTIFKEMQDLPTEKQMNRKPPRVGRNEPCPCGSGKKFKKCCLIKSVAHDHSTDVVKI